VGTRTIAYDVDGLRDSVAAAGGVLCQPAPAALAEALIEVLPRWRTESYAPGEYGGALSWRDVAVEVLASAVFDGNVDVDVVPPTAAAPTADRLGIPVGASVPGGRA
jgi:hypothetical protein